MSQDLYSNMFQAEAELLGKTVFFLKEIQVCCILKRFSIKKLEMQKSTNKRNINYTPTIIHTLVYKAFHFFKIVNNLYRIRLLCMVS